MRVDAAHQGTICQVADHPLSVETKRNETKRKRDRKKAAMTRCVAAASAAHVLPPAGNAAFFPAGAFCQSIKLHSPQFRTH